MLTYTIIISCTIFGCRVVYDSILAFSEDYIKKQRIDSCVHNYKGWGIFLSVFYVLADIVPNVLAIRFVAKTLNVQGQMFVQNDNDVIERMFNSIGEGGSRGD